LLCFAVGVITEASLLLQMKNEYPYLSFTYLGDISAQAVIAKKIIEESYATRDNSYRIFAFPFGLGAKRVA